MTYTDTTPDVRNPRWDETIAKYADVIVPSTNVAGWTGARQRRFLEAIADGDTVRDACRFVGLSTASAYAFRRRAGGRAFDLGWRAADLLARERVAADLMARAAEGQEVTITRADGSTVTRHHHDNRLALTLLARLDRYADAAERTAPGQAARTVAGDFDGYLDLVGNEGGPARAGLFMLARSDAAEAAELEPVLALARADRMIRCGTLAADMDVADLDPAQRAGWTAEQWARAEAAGLIALAPPPAPAFTCQPVSTDPEAAPEPDDAPVWWSARADGWRTRFPPHRGFLGEQMGEFGDEGYERELDWDELDIVEEPHRVATAARRVAEAAERDRWFAELAAEIARDAAPAAVREDAAVAAAPEDAAPVAAPEDAALAAGPGHAAAAATLDHARAPGAGHAPAEHPGPSPVHPDPAPERW